jgi:hypothetical protein
MDGADDKNYFGLAPGKTVYLKGVCKVTCIRALCGTDGKPLELRVTYEDPSVVSTTESATGKKAKVIIFFLLPKCMLIFLIFE